MNSNRDEVIRGPAERHSMALGGYEAAFNDNLQEMEAGSFLSRIWKKDAAFWKNEEAHQQVTKNALGWLTVVEMMMQNVADLKTFASEIRDSGYQHVVVLGMGGSSLCPEVLSRTFGRQDRYPQLLVLDSTVPAAIHNLEKKIDVARTLFIVASKSGTTIEPHTFHRYFYELVKERLKEGAGNNFIAITDPGTKLTEDAKYDRFRRVFLNPADIGGRYSALSFFGMVPFALMGGDAGQLLDRAHQALQACSSTVPAKQNVGARLGAALGTLAEAGRDKLTVITSASLDSIGLWIEQLAAESTGKEGRGIVPVAGEPLGTPGVYGDDRIFVYLHTKADLDSALESKLAALQAAGHPCLRHVLRDAYDLGEEFFLWEFATAVAAKFLGIDPFDQPNVQESKDNTRRLLGEFTSSGSLSQQRLVLREGELSLLADSPARHPVANSGDRLIDSIAAQLAQIRPRDYFALTAYIEEMPEHETLLQQIRIAVRDRWRVATTSGYGPRFLHSTGQLHKGGADNGVFLQITAKSDPDLDIPGEPFTFGLLKDAQALGDYQSLAQRQRRAIRLELGTNVTAGLRELYSILQKITATETTSASF